MSENSWKALITGAAGGLVAWWAMDRFYRLARKSASGETITPYCIGAAAGAAYGQFVVRRYHQPIARVPLGAAVYLANPEETAAPPKGGRDAGEKAENFALRLASKGLKKMAEAVLLG
ncbi:MAG TPA: hypothetical protein VKX49_15165 [Bryobacteraceae bacterium]|nr:hypothetical protein [Bryobacteraceae bacterium]